jgi:hypothetical protein
MAFLLRERYRALAAAVSVVRKLPKGSGSGQAGPSSQLFQFPELLESAYQRRISLAMLPAPPGGEARSGRCEVAVKTWHAYRWLQSRTLAEQESILFHIFLNRFFRPRPFAEASCVPYRRTLLS